MAVRKSLRELDRRIWAVYTGDAHDADSAPVRGGNAYMRKGHVGKRMDALDFTLLVALRARRA